MPFVPTEEMLEQARSLPAGLCDHCLGRRFARIQEATNEERGRAVRKALGLPEPQGCPFCENLFKDLDGLAAAIIKRIGEREYSSFLMGAKQEKAVLELEEKHGYPENLRSEVNRELGKRLEALTGKEADFDNPDITFIVDTRFAGFDIQVAPIYIFGRYRKLERGIPQTRWPCRECRGKGCKRCEGTGKMYQTSVEELIAVPIMGASGGTAHSLHGMGREDIDARMLGSGRPFVVEIQNPMKRKLDLPALESQINGLSVNRVEALGLRPSSLKEVRALKASRMPKIYIADVSFSSPVPEEKLKLLETTFTGLQVVQRTPERVAHRRADLDRTRKVLEFRVESPSRFRITGEAGLYIKELIHGDGGRTRPSVSETLGVQCSVDALDVIEMGGDWDGKGIEGLPCKDEKGNADKPEE
jgi:tRNA pseudouridine synthase 10